MSTVELSLLAVAIEFGVIALGLWIWMLLRQRRSARQDQEGAEALQEEVEAKEPTRREALRTIFAERYNVDEEQLDAKVEEFVERERSFYQALLTVYLKHDPAGLAKMGDELHKVIAPWVSMVPEGMVDGPTVEALHQDLSTLNGENQTLSRELERTKQVMETLLGEYNAAFGESEEKLEETVQLEIHTGDGTPAEPLNPDDLDLDVTAANENGTAGRSSDKDVAPEDIDKLLEEAAQGSAA